MSAVIRVYAPHIHMKPYAGAILVSLSLAVTALPIADAAVTPDSKCSKAGIKEIYKVKK